MTCHKSMLADLQGRGLRLTAQRALILEDLYHHPGHRTVEDIFAHLGERLPGLNRATVYRTLGMLRDAGVLATFSGPDGITEFELIGLPAERHHHLVCHECGAEYALDPLPVERFGGEIRSATGFRPDLNHLVIFGLCETCAERSH